MRPSIESLRAGGGLQEGCHPHRQEVVPLIIIHVVEHLQAYSASVEVGFCLCIGDGYTIGEKIIWRSEVDVTNTFQRRNIALRLAVARHVAS